MSDHKSNIVYFGKHKPTRDTDAQVGYNLRRIRLSRGLERAHFANILGIKEAHLMQLEAGQTSIYASEIFQFAEALKLPVLKLYMGEPTKTDKDLAPTLKQVLDIEALRDECMSHLRAIDDPETLLRLRDHIAFWAND